MLIISYSFGPNLLSVEEQNYYRRMMGLTCTLCFTTCHFKSHTLKLHDLTMRSVAIKFSFVWKINWWRVRDFAVNSLTYVRLHVCIQCVWHKQKPPTRYFAIRLATEAGKTTRSSMVSLYSPWVGAPLLLLTFTKLSRAGGPANSWTHIRFSSSHTGL